ncbi:MAG: hypothetical protein ABFS12_16730, partial [Bacteroidota bacterium]
SFPGTARYNGVAFSIDGKGYVGLGQSSGDIFHGAWTLELMMDRLNQRKMDLPRPFHDDIALDSPDSGKGADKPDKAALCNYYEYARGAAYEHTYQILKDKLK